MSPNRPLKVDDIRKPELTEGAHPFAEEKPQGKEADANAPVDYTGAYEPAGQSSGGLLLIMAILGILASSLPLTTYIWLEAGWLLGIFGWLVSWIIALPTLVFASNDLRSIRLGRLIDHGKWMVSLAFCLSLLTVVISIATVAVFLFSSGG